jgi:hypothetical protein
LEGGVGDVLALENENAQIDHMKEINQEILSGSVSGINDGTTTTFVVPEANARFFHVGDTVYLRDDSATGIATQTGTISESTPPSTTGGNTTFTLSTTAGNTAWSGSANADSGDLAYVRQRAGLTSIDDIVAEDAQPAHGNGWGAAAVDKGVGVYDLTGMQRTQGLWASGANVSYNGGTARDLSLNLLDTAIQKVRENGGEPKLIILGHDQYFKLERLLNSQQRYMGQEEYQVGVGSERTFPGTRTGLVLATYMGIPILPDADTPFSTSSAGVRLGSNIYVLDTDYLEIAIAQPTQYIENRDYFAADKLVVRGLLYTMGEFRCKNFFVQAKIGDLSA